MELLFCDCMWCSGGARALHGDAADDHSALLWSCCSATVCGAARGCEDWMRTLRTTTRCPDSVGSRISPNNMSCDVALCPAYIKSSFGWPSRLIQFMVTAVKKLKIFCGFCFWVPGVILFLIRYFFDAYAYANMIGAIAPVFPASGPKQWRSPSRNLCQPFLDSTPKETYATNSSCGYSSDSKNI